MLRHLLKVETKRSILTVSRHLLKPTENKTNIANKVNYICAILLYILASVVV
jgi:hypothetical protein